MSSPTEVIYPPIPLWFGKWIMAPMVIIVGLIFCGFACAKDPDTKPFRVQDLFRRIPMREKTKAQLLIEGIFGIGLGIICFLIL
jgi:hypothetical protein